MSTETNESKIINKLGAMAVSETITLSKEDVASICIKRLRVYISRYQTQNAKSFKTQCALDGRLHILRQADPVKK
ncbi:hypothetical protein VPH1254_0053 [Vibrio phage 1254]|nr:hypothetical protein SIPHO018v1_10001 [Vibrio phage 11E33.1]QZI86743.1 hypothetical protein SIPHO019v1_200002 [Vibrio phage 82E32.1]QZI92548.1 hypothetical protein SIPHO017v1_p0015 [Vibrio phage 19E33.1]QZI92967.1 hypothetical protein SIPHO015v1_p0029 [Vibrio phage 82E32.2]QZI93014.1 hypothetical protein SIPHO014v1_p0015 [Vibrio phage 82E32.3]QZI93125.1 hypothetical protein SIPHO013v1_p0064 [Vibrio phage 82E33.2]